MRSIFLCLLGCLPAATWATSTRPDGSPHTESSRPLQMEANNKASSEKTVQRDGISLRPYEAADYRLAYDIFVGANDLANALRIAKEAIKHEPQDPDWRVRLARVAEWSGQPALAWEQRLWLYQHARRDRETREALLRLGWAYGSPAMMLELWLEEAGQRPLTPQQWEEVRRLFEANARPAEGARYFAQQYRQSGDARFLSWAAELAEHAGLEDEALRLFLERAQLEPFSHTAVLSAASILIRRDRLREAHQLLMRFASRIPDEERDYWRMVGDIAWELLETESAEHAYRRYLQQEQAETGIWSRLIFLVQQKNPQEAAQLALYVYRRQGGIDYLIQALALLGAKGSSTAQAEVLAAVRSEDLPALEANPRFLLLRAAYHQGTRRFAAAWQDLERALTIAPEDEEAAATALWFLIDRRDLGRLPDLLSRWQARADNTPALWLPFAAAFHVLDRYREAVPWYRKEIARQPNDMLLLLNYADLIERLQQPGMALRIRRHAWLMLQKNRRLEDLREGVIGSAELLAMARLYLLDRPGDAAAALIQKVANHLRHLTDATQHDEQVQDLVLAWAIGSDQFLNARSWMWLNYLRHQKTPPGWGEAQTALQLNDTGTLHRMLETGIQTIPIYNRYDSAYTLEHWQQALDIAFHGMEKNPDDEPLYDRYRIHAPLHSDYVQLSWRAERLGDYQALKLETEMHLNVSRRLALNFDWHGQSQSSHEPQLDLFAPDRARLLGIEAVWRGSHGDTRGAFFRHQELEGLRGLRLAQNWCWSRRTALEGSIERNGEATDSLPLRFGGKQHSVRLGFDHNLSKRETLHLALRQSAYATQIGDSLGSGRFLDLGLTHRFRTEYPDWRLRATLSIARYRYASTLGARSLNALAPEVRTAVAAGALDPVRYFLPDGSRTLGMCFGMGENLAGQNIRTTYSRGWRHYYELCGTHNDVTGLGYSIDFGVVGSLTGDDHVLFGLSQSTRSIDNPETDRQLRFSYRRYF